MGRSRNGKFAATARAKASEAIVAARHTNKQVRMRFSFSASWELNQSHQITAIASPPLNRRLLLKSLMPLSKASDRWVNWLKKRRIASSNEFIEEELATALVVEPMNNYPTCWLSRQ